MQRANRLLVCALCLVLGFEFAEGANADGLLRLPGATLLLGWGDIDTLSVTTPTQIIHILKQPETKGYGSPNLPSITHDGKFVGCIRLKSLEPQRVAVATYSILEKKWTEYAEFPYLSTVSISPDGSKLAFSAKEGGGSAEMLHIVDLRTGSKTVIPEVTSPGTLSWAPDSQNIAFEFNQGFGSGEYQPVIKVVTLKSGKIRKLVDGRSPSWSPSGEWVAFINQSKAQCMVVHPDGSDSRTLFALHQRLLRISGSLDLPPVWSPDASKLAVTRVWTEGTPPDILMFDMAKHDLKKLKSSVPVLGWAESN